MRELERGTRPFWDIVLRTWTRSWLQMVKCRIYRPRRSNCGYSGCSGSIHAKAPLQKNIVPAMQYGLTQALQMGSMNLQNWRSLQNSQMATNTNSNGSYQSPWLPINARNFLIGRLRVQDMFNDALAKDLDDQWRPYGCIDRGIDRSSLRWPKISITSKRAMGLPVKTYRILGPGFG